MSADHIHVPLSARLCRSQDRSQAAAGTAMGPLPQRARTPSTMQPAASDSTSLMSPKMMAWVTDTTGAPPMIQASAASSAAIQVPIPKHSSKQLWRRGQMSALLLLAVFVAVGTSATGAPAPGAFDLRIVNDALPVLSVTAGGKDFGQPVEFQKAGTVAGLPLPTNPATSLLVLVRCCSGLAGTHSAHSACSASLSMHGDIVIVVVVVNDL